MLRTATRLSVVIILLIAAMAGSGCKENTLINSKVSPSANAIGIFDTSLSCITHTFQYDSAVTSTNIGGIPVYQAVGGYLDPFFGTMSASTFFQVVPLNVTPTVLDTAIIDSVIMVLPYSGFTYGDTTNRSVTQTYQVFYITEPLDSGATYYSTNTRGIDATFPLSDPVAVNVHALRDSFGYNTDPRNYPGLRIKLKTNHIAGLLKTAQQAINTANPLRSFIQRFNGICVKPADNNFSTSAIPYFQLEGSTIYSEASLLVYYRRNASDSTNIAPYYFDQSSCNHFNSISQSYGHYPVNTLYNSKAANDEIVAVQNLPGATIDVLIPGISHLPAGVINKAELQLVVLPGYGNKTGPDSVSVLPEKLYPQGIAINGYPADGTSGLEYTITDYFPLSNNVMDGYLHQVKRGNTTVNAYTINIPREVMLSIKAKNDTLHLHINGTFEFYGAYHLVAGGGNYPDTLYRPKLFVVYSKLSN